MLDITTQKDIFQNTASSLKDLICSLTMDSIAEKLQSFRSNLLKEMEASI